MRGRAPDIMEIPKEFGRFEVSTVLGRGGMGTVYRAFDPVIGRDVAIKEISISSNLSEDEKAELKARYELEFRAAGKLSHPNVVTVYDVGQSGDSYFIAMELVEGMSLADALANGEPMKPQRVLDLGRQIAAGIDYAHRHDIVHRDIKPANILLTEDERAKITDFGLVKMQMLASRLTQAGTVLGTPAYMSPEQVLGHSVDARTDQFSFAVLLYQMLTAETPFQADHPSAILYKIVNEQPQAPATRNTSLTSAVDDIILRALSKSPDERFESCTDLIDSLAAVFTAPTASITVTTVPEPEAPAPEARTAQRLDAQVRISAARSSPWLKWLGGVAAIAGLAFVGYLASSRFQRSLEPETPPGEISAATTGAIEHPIAVRGPTGGEIWVDDELVATLGANEQAPLTISGAAGDRRLIELRIDGRSVDSFELTLGADEQPNNWSPRAGPAARALEITSQPEGARVIVDGEALSSPTPTVLDVEDGATIDLRLELEGYESAGWSFALDDLSTEQRESGRLHFPLRSSQPPGVVLVTASYPVEVRIGSRRLSAASQHRIELRPGRHEVELVAADVFLRHAYNVTVASGREERIQPPKAVPVSIAASPANCRVSIDGSFVDVTPINDRLLTVGQHEFVFEWPAQGRTKTSRLTISRPRQRIFETLD